MDDKFIYVVMEDGEFSSWFFMLDSAQYYCECLSNEGVDLLIIEIPVRDILKFEG